MIVSVMLIFSVAQEVLEKLHWLEFWRWLSTVVPGRVMASLVVVAIAVLGFGEGRRH
jgi:type IV secretory pathway VirB2 component (pilin)